MQSQEAWEHAADRIEAASDSLDAYRFVVREVERRSGPQASPEV